MEIVEGVLFPTLLLSILFGFLIWIAFRIGKNRMQKIQDQTRLKVYQDYIEGVGLVIQKGTSFSGIAFGSSAGDTQTVFGGTPDSMELRNFKLTYAQIASVDILVKKECALVIHTAKVSYVCYLDKCEKYRDVIFQKISTASNK